MPVVSVIIPAYNSQLTIRETIQSVQQQTIQDFELIVIDDGSADGTVQCVEAIADARIRVFAYPNAGVSAARNRGMAQATGEYIALLDADDLWTADKLERQLAALQQHPEAGVAYSWTAFMEMDAAGQPTFYPSQAYAFSGQVYRQLLIGDFIHSGSNPLIRRAAVAATGGFTLGIEACADWDYWLRLAADWPFVVVPRYQILYRRRAGAMSSQLEQMEQTALAAVERAYQSAPAELQDLKPETLAGFHAYCADLAVRYGRRPDLIRAQGHLWSALQLRPQNLLDAYTQKLHLKLWIQLLLPKALANPLLSALRKPVTIGDPRYSA